METWINIVFSAIALISSIFAIIYTRLNLKTQKFIETITTQRIKWIESLRNDLSDVVSGLNMLSFCENHFMQFDKFVEYVGFDNPEEKESAYQYRDSLKRLKGKLDAELTRIDLIKKVDLSILKLNGTDDSELINKLEKIKESLLHENYAECTKDDYLNKLKFLIAGTLKKEWEKVKFEVKRGRMRR